MNHFRHANLQIGDKAFYTLKACDLMRVTNNQNLMKQQTSAEGLEESAKDNGKTEHSKTDLGEVAAVNRNSVVSEGNLSSESSRESIVTESDSKSSFDSIAEAASEIKVEGTCSDEASGGTNQADVHDNQQTAGSDSADGDVDSDGGETVTPKTKGGGSLRHDPGLSHSLRFPTKRRKKRLRRKRKAAPPLKVNVGDKVCVEVTHTCTTVDVVWQDGSTRKKVLSTDLIPVFHLDELEFFPGDYVSDKRGED